MSACRIVVLAGVLALSLAPTVLAQGNPNPGNPNNPPGNPNNPPGNPNQQQAPTGLTLAAQPNPVVFNSTTVLSGRLTGGNTGGVRVLLVQDTTRPYGDSYEATTLAATTENNGRFSLSVRPTVNTQYRAVAQSAPPVTSAARLVSVRTRVGLTLSDSTPRRGSLVRFRGTVAPAHDGRRALIQKRSPSGRFVTVARAALTDAGTARSAYSKRLRVFRDGVYRVKVAGDADHVNGFSRTRSVNVG